MLEINEFCKKRQRVANSVSDDCDEDSEIDPRIQTTNNDSSIHSHNSELSSEISSTVGVAVNGFGWALMMLLELAH